MSSDREVMSEQSLLVHKGAGYDKVYPLGHQPMEDLKWSPEREPSTHSLAGEENEEEKRDEEE